MDYNTMLASAIALASEAHIEQRDLHGKAYILHPLRVRQSIEDAGYSIPYQVVGVLHDVLEDQPRFSPHVSHLLPAELHAALRAVTRTEAISTTPKETYTDFVRRALEHPIGIVVKFFDIIDNFDVSRLHHKAPISRYRWALKQLLDKNPNLRDGIQDRHYDSCPELNAIVKDIPRARFKS